MIDAVTIVPVITTVVEVIKRAGLPHKFLPLVSIVLGVVASAFTNTSLNFDVVLYGVVMGLSAVGLFEGIKTPVEVGRKMIGK